MVTIIENDRKILEELKKDILLGRFRFLDEMCFRFKMTDISDVIGYRFPGINIKDKYIFTLESSPEIHLTFEVNQCTGECNLNSRKRILKGKRKKSYIE